MTVPSQRDLELRTTDGDVAVANLSAQIDGLTAQLHRARSTQPTAAPLTGPGVAPLVTLLLLRGQVLARVADYRQAEELAEALVRNAPNDAEAWLSRARAKAMFHRFSEALADLNAAGQRGADRVVLDAERAAILQAIGCDVDALALRRTAAMLRADFSTLGALAVLQAERGAVTVAERLFTKARRHYRGVSPFPVVDLDFRRGHMCLRQQRLAGARAWFTAAVCRVPQYAPALGHLAEVEATMGDHEAAISRLRPLVVSSDDPEYMAGLSQVLSRAGCLHEARRWRDTAAASYEDLIARHPEAFADHAAHFWRTVGGDRRRAIQLTEQAGAYRQAARELA
jgi:tetratricopeptide (TPR) repeat protein